jgi:hypothetical protein
MWWQYLIMAVVVIAVVYAFVSLTGFQTRRLTRKTDRTAEDMYDSYADPGRQAARVRPETGRRVEERVGAPGTLAGTTSLWQHRS